jgi:hypothetical protein
MPPLLSYPLSPSILPPLALYTVDEIRSGKGKAIPLHDLTGRGFQEVEAPTF